MALPNKKFYLKNKSKGSHSLPTVADSVDDLMENEKESRI